MKQTKDIRLTLFLSYGLGFILLLLPLHAIITTWIGSQLGHIDLVRIWKELLLIPLALLSLWVGLRNESTAKWLRTSKLFYFILAYIVLQVVTGIVASSNHNVNGNALIYALLINTRYLIIFLLCVVVSMLNPWLKNHWKLLLLLPAGVAVGFGLLQRVLLPADFLRHFGYGPNTTLPYVTVDQKPQYVRLQSTLRGPNPLGAYLLLIFAAIFGLLCKLKNWRKYGVAFGIATLIVLYFTYSRTALIGVALVVLLTLWRILKTPRQKQLFIATACLVAVVGLSSLFALRHNDTVQNIFFHTDEHSLSPNSSNQQHGVALRSGVSDIIHQPLGRGPGTAGPASVRNDHPVRLAENYYLQVGQEVGILGLLLFLIINLIVFVFLWQQHDTLSLILLTSFVGITFTNLFLHAWADDTLSLIWWALLGISYGSAQRKPQSSMR